MIEIDTRESNSACASFVYTSMLTEGLATCKWNLLPTGRICDYKRKARVACVTLLQYFTVTVDSHMRQCHTHMK